MKVTDCDVEIIGPYPPPYGGISLHISRLLPLLNQEGIKAKVYNQYDFEDKKKRVFATNKSLFWWFCYIFKKKSSIVHIHQFSWFHFPYLFPLARLTKSKVFLTIHNEKILALRPFFQQVIFFLLRISRLSKIFVVSQSVFEIMEKNCFCNLEWLPAYVPPQKGCSANLVGEYSRKVVFNSWRVSDKGAVFTYGVDHLVSLAKAHPNIGFYFFVGDFSSKPFVDKLLSAETFSNIQVIYGENLTDYLGGADLFLRLNRDDAYGVSVQEALDLGTPAIASDVCRRAPGAILYRTGDFEDLSRVFCDVLSKDPGSLMSSIQSSSHHSRLIYLYKSNLDLVGR